MVSSITLQSRVIDNNIAFDKGLVRLPICSFDRWPVQVDLRIDHEERVVRVDDVVVDWDAIEVLLQQTLKEHILLLQSCLLLLNSKLVQQNFIVTLVEIV